MRIHTDQVVSIKSVNLRKQKAGAENVLAMDIDCALLGTDIDCASRALSVDPYAIERLFDEDGNPSIPGITVTGANHDHEFDIRLGLSQRIEDRANAVRKIRMIPREGHKVDVSFQIQITEPNDQLLLEVQTVGLVQETLTMTLKPRQGQMSLVGSSVSEEDGSGGEIPASEGEGAASAA